MEKQTIDMSEVRRLQKAARDGNKEHLKDWIYQFDAQIRAKYEKDALNLNKEIKEEYEKAFKKELDKAIENYMVAIVYSLKFSELTKFGPKRINNFLKDVSATVDMFTTNEYTPEEYKKILSKHGIDLFIEKGGEDNE